MSIHSQLLVAFTLSFAVTASITACGSDDDSNGSHKGGTGGSAATGGGGKGGSGGLGASGGSSGSGATGATGGTAGSGATAGVSGSGGSAGVDGSAGAAGSCAGTFTNLGDLTGGAKGSTAAAISRDGTTVVGQSESTNGLEAMRWQLAGGMKGLGDLTGGTFESTAIDVSADGSVVVGTSHSALVDCPGRLDEGFRWTSPGGMVALGDIATGCFFSEAYAVSSDGTFVAGGATNALSNTAATWSTTSGTWTDLGFAAIVENSSLVTAMSGDHNWLVGNDRLDASASYRAFRWSSAGGEELLGDLPGGLEFASAHAVSDDGSVVVGQGTSASGSEAFRWTSAGGMVGLGDFAGGAFSSNADAITPDGKLIVGFGTSASGPEAAIWDSTLTITRLADFVTSHGVIIPTGWTLSAATGITVNGKDVFITGNGTNPSGDSEAWLVRYCAP